MTQTTADEMFRFKVDKREKYENICTKTFLIGVPLRNSPMYSYFAYLLRNITNLLKILYSLNRLHYIIKYLAGFPSLMCTVAHRPCDVL